MVGRIDKREKRKVDSFSPDKRMAGYRRGGVKVDKVKWTYWVLERLVHCKSALTRPDKVLIRREGGGHVGQGGEGGHPQ